MTTLAYETFGAPGKPAIMLLHGFMSSNAQWLANRDALSDRYRLVMIELWGHGASPLPADPGQFSIAGYLREFDTIRQALDIESWTLVGQSYGAGLAIHYALHFPEHSDAVIVTNSRSAFGRVGRDESAGNGDAEARQSALDKDDFDLRTLPFHPIHARRFPDHIKNALVQSADAMTADAIRQGGRLGISLHTVNVLANLTVPFLLTNGRYEKSFQADLERLLSLYPGLNVAHLEGGHSVNIEAAEGFNDACLAFLEKVHTGAGASFIPHLPHN